MNEAMIQVNLPDVDFEEKYKEDLQRLRGFRLLGDDFMSKVFEDKACAERLLQIVLGHDVFRVQTVLVQHEIKASPHKAVRRSLCGDALKKNRKEQLLWKIFPSLKSRKKAPTL